MSLPTKWSRSLLTQKEPEGNTQKKILGSRAFLFLSLDPLFFIHAGVCEIPETHMISYTLCVKHASNNELALLGAGVMQRGGRLWMKTDMVFQESEVLILSLKPMQFRNYVSRV